MDESQDNLSQDVSNADEVMSSVGVDPEQNESMNGSESGSMAKDGDPVGVKKRLGMQAKKHQREMRAMQEQLAQMQAHMQSQMGQQQPSQNQSAGMMPPNVQGMSIEEQIQRGVQYALQAKEMQERKAKEAEQAAHVHKQYLKMNDEFDKASDKYDDFDDVVRGNTPYTEAMRDALLLVDNPAEVAYKLGKDPETLQRVAKLHPLDQAREINKLSFALMSGNGKAPNAQGNGSRPLSNIKVNPASSQAITDKTPASAIRARMKAGTFK